jgi:hypothetical protein
MAGCQTSAGVAAYENCGAGPMGLQPYGAIGNGNIDAWIAAAVAQSKPSGAPSDYSVSCAANVRARGIIYYHSTPGDCGAPQATSGITTPQIVGLSGAASSGVVGGLGVAGVIGGAATLGITAAITVAVGALEAIFAHHAQAVANEQATICQVINYFNPIVARLDAAVRSGVISSDEGITYLSQVAASARNGLAGIMKTCNASCVYQGTLQAHIFFAKNFYPAIAPVSIFPQAPGNPPDGYGTPPGGVTVTGNNPPPPPPIRSLPSNTYAPAGPSPIALGDGSAPAIQSNSQIPGNPLASDYLNLGYNQQTGQSAQAADLPNSTINWTIVAAVVGIVALFILVARGS